MASSDCNNQTVSEESRFSLLTDALNQSTQKIINNILSHKAMAECLPQLKKKKPEMLAQLHAILTNTVEKKLKEELDQFIVELSLKDKLDFVDQLDMEQAELSTGETVWRPTGVPARDLLAYDMPALQTHKAELESYLRKLHTENEEEKKKILRTVEEVGAAERNIEALLAKNEETLSILAGIPTL